MSSLPNQSLKRASDLQKTSHKRGEYAAKETALSSIEIGMTSKYQLPLQYTNKSVSTTAKNNTNTNTNSIMTPRDTNGTTNMSSNASDSNLETSLEEKKAFTLNANNKDEKGNDKDKDNVDVGDDDEVNDKHEFGKNNDEDDEDSSNEQEKYQQPMHDEPPIISNSTANFSLVSINPHIICTLCNGYFRDPYTITECLHVFCKSCLFFAFQSGFRKCPKCDASLEPDPYREVLSDRTLGELVHKILPELKEKDDKDEYNFYERRGIKRKIEFRRNDTKQLNIEKMQNETMEKTRREMKKQMPKMTGDEIDFTLIPATDLPQDYTMPTLENPLLRTSGKLKIIQIKKYLLKKLDLKVPHTSIEILCNGDRLGDELSLTFVYRTRWLFPAEDLSLNYRFGQEGLY